MKRLSLSLATLIAACAVLAGFTSGCATGRNTQPAANQNVEIQPDKALVVFLRPSSMAYAISSSVFDSTGDTDEFIASIGPNEKVAYYCAPGHHLFMVIAENADFMEADLAAGKVYYAVVTPRMGMWKARFGLHPVKKTAGEKEFEYSSGTIDKWLKGCHYVTPNEGSKQWAANNAGNIHTRRLDYAKKWDAMLPEDKQWRTLDPEDGLDQPLD